ncbi:nicotinamide-nucleotide amidohydrolase family protein [Plantibacter sp. ME-Dv--P-122b]|uniref:CinA family protein n=1 Tax=Plantibacter sp. ME-Dv--P-122b TaxID=3040300 RepID=UPI00254E277C|nr:nicotinamide-nucleotide amidohydrolase family protein [Plantibacter sp. ME-Dv--P-122b]
MTPDAVESADADATSAVHALVDARLTIGVAESLTGGLLAAALINVPGASATVRGGVVAYDTRLKHSLLGVDAGLLALHGAVHPEVALQMADGVRRAMAIDGLPADVGIATTGVAGPDPQDGQAVGTVFVGIVTRAGGRVVPLTLDGGRQEIRHRTVELALEALVRELGALG